MRYFRTPIFTEQAIGRARGRVPTHARHDHTGREQITIREPMLRAQATSRAPLSARALTSRRRTCRIPVPSMRALGVEMSAAAAMHSQTQAPHALTRTHSPRVRVPTGDLQRVRLRRATHHYVVEVDVVAGASSQRTCARFACCAARTRSPTPRWPCPPRRR